MWLARRTLFHEPIQIIVSATAIGLSIMLVVVLLGVLAGVRRQASDDLPHVRGAGDSPERTVTVTERPSSKASRS